MKKGLLITTYFALVVNFTGVVMFAVSHHFFELNSILDHLALCGVLSAVVIAVAALKIAVLREKLSFYFGKFRDYFVILNCCLAMFMYLVFPFQVIGTVDRSRSLFMFEWVACAPRNSTLIDVENQIDKVFGKEAVVAFNLRLREQENRGLMKIASGRPELTYGGHVVFSSAVEASRIFSLRGWQQNFIWENNKCGY